SSSVNAILEAVSATAGINRKQLFEKVAGDGANEEAEPRRLAIASDLRWLISEGYVIEFNDGSFDLPRTKSQPPRESVETLVAASTCSTDQAVKQSAATWPLQLTWREP